MAMAAPATARPLSALDVIYGRRSVRSYVRKPLEASTIQALLDAAVQAPTAVLEQPWLFVVVEDPRLLACISDRAKGLLSSPEATHDSISADQQAVSRRAGFAKRIEDPAFNLFYDAPVLIVICARRLNPFVVADCWLAAENLMLAATALGLGSCCIGAAVGALNTAEIKTLLRMPEDVEAVAPIVVGIPAAAAVPVSRREPEIVSWR